MNVVSDFAGTLSDLLQQSVYRWALLLAALAALLYSWNAIMSFFPRG